MNAVLAHAELFAEMQRRGWFPAWLALLLVSLDGLRGARAAGLAEPAPVPLEG